MTQLSDVYGTAHAISAETWLALLANAGYSGFVDFPVGVEDGGREGDFDLQRTRPLVVIECNWEGKVKDLSLTTDNQVIHAPLFRRDPVEVLLWLGEVLP
jgi:hypothetical protein